MAVIGGRGGIVNGVSSIRNWSVNSSAALVQAIASDTKGAPVVLEGNKDWSGAYDRYGHTPASMPGDALSFVGSVDGAKGVSGTAIVDGVEIACDIENALPISHVVSFSGNGSLTKNDSTASSDSGTPDPPPSKGCNVQIATPSGTPLYSDIEDVRSYRISFASENQAYADSDTAGLMKRVRGDISANVSISVYSDDLSQLPGENDFKFVRLFVDATTYWEFVAIAFSDQSDFVIDRETNAIIGCTLNGVFSGFYDLSGTMTEGNINYPDEDEYWPTDAKA